MGLTTAADGKDRHRIGRHRQP